MVRVVSEEGYLHTGIAEIDTELAGGINMGSLVFMEGNVKTGKSVVYEHMIYQALRCDGRSVACYITRNSVKGFIGHMASLHLPVIDDFLADRLRVFPLEVPKGTDEVKEYVRKVTDHIAVLPERFDLVIFDSVTAALNAFDTSTTLDFLYVCKGLCNEKTSLVLVADSYAFKKGTLPKVMLAVDAFIRFHSEYRRLTADIVDSHLIRTMNVSKLNGIERLPHDGVRFNIEADGSLRIMPITELSVS